MHIHKVVFLSTVIALSFCLPTVTLAASPSCSVLSRSLSIGATGADVTALQSYLTTTGRLAGAPTGYYGSATTQAVQSLQRSVGILSSGTPNSTGYGSAGPRTLAYIKNQLACGQASTSAGALPDPINKMYAALANTQSYHVTTQLSLVAAIGSSENTIKMDITADGVRMNRPSGDGVYHVHLSEAAPGSASPYAFDMELRLVDGKQYINYSTFPSLFGVDATPILNTWIALDWDSGSDASTFDQGASVSQDLLGELTNRSVVTSVTERGSTATTYGYDLEISADGIRKLTSSALSSAGTASALQASNSSLPIAMSAHIDIDRTTYLPTSLTVTATAGQGSIKETINGKNSFDRYDTRFSVSVPPHALTATDLLKKLSATGDSSAKSSTTELNLESLQTEAALFYDDHSSYSGLCKDSEVSSLVNKLSGASCYAATSGKAYAAVASLSTGGYWCVDSTGYSAHTTRRTISTSDQSCK